MTKNEVVVVPGSYCKPLKASELPEGFARFFPLFAPSTSTSSSSTASTDASSTPLVGSGTGLPSDLLLAVLEGLRTQVANVRAALERVEVRMISASLLLLYEADHVSAHKALKKLEEGPRNEEDESEDAENENEEDEEDEDEDEDEDKGAGPLFVARLIDFAHTRIALGEGPDEGVLKGIDTVLKLFDTRIGQVKSTLMA